MMSPKDHIDDEAAHQIRDVAPPDRPRSVTGGRVSRSSFAQPYSIWPWETPEESPTRCLPPTCGAPELVEAVRVVIDTLVLVGGLAGGVGAIGKGRLWLLKKTARRVPPLSLDLIQVACVSALERNFGVSPRSDPQAASLENGRFLFTWREGDYRYDAEGVVTDPKRSVKLTRTPCPTHRWTGRFGPGHTSGGD